MPFLERWMKDQIGFGALKKAMMKESERWAQTLPQIPRLVHQALAHSANDPTPELLKRIDELQQSHRRMRQGLWMVAGLLIALLAVASVGLSQSLVLMY
jgi:ubiquinone biosynthesis protein